MIGGDDDEFLVKTAMVLPCRCFYRIPIWQAVRHVAATIPCVSQRQRLLLSGPCAWLLTVCRGM